MLGAQRTPPSQALQRCWEWLAPGGVLGARFALTVAAVLAASWLLYFVTEDLLVAVAGEDQRFVSSGQQPGLALIRSDLRLFGGLMTLAAATLAGAALVIARASSMFLRAALRLIFTTLCAAVILRALMTAGFEGEWYRLETVLSEPESMPIFGRRLLFVWPAMALTKLHDVITPYRAFLVVQAFVAWFACASVESFCRRFGGTVFALAGEAVFTMLTAAVIDYFNFYDIGISLFFTLGLIAALSGRWALFALVVGIGTLNHENALLLIPTALFVRWGAESPRRLALAGAASLAVHVAARTVMAALVPASGLLHLRIWTNATSVLYPSMPLAHALSILGPAFLAAGIGIRYADRPLSRMALLVPMLLAVTFLAGKLGEPRQFIACFPVIAALIVTTARQLAPKAETS